MATTGAESEDDGGAVLRKQGQPTLPLLLGEVAAGNGDVATEGQQQADPSSEEESVRAGGGRRTALAVLEKRVSVQRNIITIRGYYFSTCLSISECHCKHRFRYLVYNST